MANSQKQNDDLEIRKDQIRIALSVGIIGFYWILFKTFWDIPKPEHFSGIRTNIIINFMYYMCSSLFVFMGFVVIFSFFIYIVCLAHKYTYKRRNYFVSDATIGRLYDTGVSVFQFGLIFYIFLGYILFCSFVLKEYFAFLSDNIKGLISLSALFFFFGLFLIVRLMIRNIDKIITYINSMSRLATLPCKKVYKKFKGRIQKSEEK